MEQSYHILQDQLKSYCADGPYPMHMPGHKRNLSPGPGLPYDFDVTEVEGTDDLHHADGILKEAMERTGKLYGSRRTWYLTCGSTCGNLAMMYAAIPRGSEVILARNCHKSVFHGAELLGLTVHWLMPEKLPDFGIPGSVRPESVEKMLRQYPQSRAVFLTSPTYEGIGSDIESIAELVHREGKLLLVDEAHGAHFGLFHGSAAGGYFPDSAVQLGADLAVQSAHKTLPSLTQTAWLHLGSDRISEEAVEQGLSVFETSSPSYPLLASLDGCTGLLAKEGPELFGKWEKRIDGIRAKAGEWKNLRILGPEDAEADRQAVFSLDFGKFLIRDAFFRRSGRELEEFLRREELLEPEMSCGRNVLLMTSCGDSEEGFDRLFHALEHLNAWLGEQKSQAAETEKCREEGIPALSEERQAVPLEEAAQRALHGKARKILLEQAEGEISAEYVMAYPPGIPLLIPGERISAEDIRTIRNLQREEGHIRRSAPGQILDNTGEVYVL